MKDPHQMCFKSVKNLRSSTFLAVEKFLGPYPIRNFEYKCMHVVLEYSAFTYEQKYFWRHA